MSSNRLIPTELKFTLILVQKPEPSHVRLFPVSVKYADSLTGKCLGRLTLVIGSLNCSDQLIKMDLIELNRFVVRSNTKNPLFND
jgi:hypothetical protein